MKRRLPPISSKPLMGRVPKKSSTDKIGANYAGLENIKIVLMLAGLISFVDFVHRLMRLGLCK